MNKAIAAIVVIILLGGGYYLVKHSSSGEMSNMNGYGTDTNGETQVTPTPTPTDTSTATSTSATSNVKEFTVSGGNFYFTPKTITVNKGDTVKITVKNDGGIHDLKIDEFNVATPRLSSGQTATVTFVADKAGSFQYYCSVGEHRAMGMWGTLTVNGQ